MMERASSINEQQLMSQLAEKEKQVASLERMNRQFQHQLQQAQASGGTGARRQ